MLNLDDFKPHLWPHQMLELGVFGGNYFANATAEDFMQLDIKTWTLAQHNMKPFSVEHNYYGARAGQTFEEWTANGWIFPEDPLGWFHWYCRYCNGRRCRRDRHQIKRWIRYRERWVRYALNYAVQHGEPTPVVKQGLLQWAIHWPRVIEEQNSE